MNQFWTTKTIVQPAMPYSDQNRYWICSNQEIIPINDRDLFLNEVVLSNDDGSSLGENVGTGVNDGPRPWGHER